MGYDLTLIPNSDSGRLPAYRKGFNMLAGELRNRYFGRRERETNRRSLPLFAFSPNGSAISLDDPFADCQTQPGTWKLPPVESLK